MMSLDLLESNFLMFKSTKFKVILNLAQAIQAAKSCLNFKKAD